MRKLFGLVLLLWSPLPAQAQSESFVVRLGRDTIAVETFVRTAARMEGELRGDAMPIRARYVVDLRDGGVTTMRLELIAPPADTAGTRVTLTFARDSVVEQTVAGGVAQPEKRSATKPGATPLLNLAFSFIELITTRARRAAGDSTAVQLYIVGVGSTMSSHIKWIGADSAALSLGGIDLRMQLDARGRILHAVVPSQNVTIERVAGTLNRSAEAGPDYSASAGAPYTAQNVSIKTKDGHVMAGTLTLPKGRTNRIPAVITISGSGPQDRDEALTGMRGYRPFRELAEQLAARGVAVLRYDDRGFGASTGVYATATSADFANDTRAVISYLRNRPEIDPERIFLVGHSEGGMIAPLVAAEDAKLRGIVLLAAPAHTGSRILEYQTRHSVDLQTQKSQAERDSLYRAGMQMLDSMALQQPWLQYFRRYDPLAVVRKVRVPVLIVHGATDRQVTAEQAPLLADALRAAGNTDVAVHVLPAVNHLFLSDPVGVVAGYASLPTRTVVPQLLQIVGDWIANKSK
jgi:dienelactone hydrolase